MRRKRLFPAIILATVAGGCATLDKEECLQADWYAIGLEDGARGYPLDRLGNHRRACSKYGVSPSPDDYAAGRTVGLRSFCTFDRGVAEGRQGRDYAGVCPDPLAEDFLAGYRHGQDLLRMERRLETLRTRIRELQEALRKGIADDEARGHAIEELARLSAEAGQLEQRLEDQKR